MSVGLLLRGTIDPSADPVRTLKKVAAFIEKAHKDDVLDLAGPFETDEGQLLVAQLHPCAEHLRITVPEPGVLELGASTSSAGPGYHQFVCDVAAAMGRKLGIAWREPSEDEPWDETGYFFTRDREELESHMLGWLGQLARILVRDADPSSSGMMMAMSIGHRYEHRSSLSTPLGPRDHAWLASTAADPRSGTDFFAWWDEGRTARTLLNRALALMWTEVRWGPSPSERDDNIQLAVLSLLEQSHELDPDLDFPWREWQELLDYQEQDGVTADIVRSRAEAAPDRPPIGYRRGNVTVAGAMGGWSITIPGSFSEEMEDEQTWLASDCRRTVRLSAYAIAGPERGPSAEQIIADCTPPEGMRLLGRWQDGHVHGHAYVGEEEEEGETFTMVWAQIAVRGAMALCSVAVEDPDDAEWALGICRSVTRPDPDDRTE